MKRSLIILLFIPLLWCGSGCNDLLLEEVEPNTVLNNFDVFGQDFKEKYGLFKVRAVNWPLLLEKYRAPLEANPTEEDLYNALTGIMVELDDSHVTLSHPTGQFKSFTGGIYGKLERAEYEDMDFELVKEKYLSIVDGLYETIYYGMLEGNIGYIYLPMIHDEPDFFKSYIPGVIADLRDTQGLVIDIRNNEGGEDESARTLASFFANERVLYMISRYKVGPGPDDFEEPRHWFVDPAEEERYLKPIVLLTNRYSVSAAETFSLAMKSFPHVIQIGDTTTGAFSDVVSRQLPNGWGYSLSVGDYRNADGISYEGVGLAPNILIKNTPEDLANGTDKMLEAAIERLK